MLCSVLSVAVPTPAGAAPQGEWVATGSPIANFANGAALAVSADGTPLLFGLAAGAVQNYHAETGAWTASGTLQIQRPGATVTPLSPGLMLLVGGLDTANAPTKTAELYNPVTNASALTAPMQVARSGHRATLLASGKVLVSGGMDANNHSIGPAEIYDPQTATWALTGTLNNGRAQHAAVLLPNGKVLVAAGIGANGPLASAEIYDPATGAWIPAAVMDQARSSAFGVALADGRALVAGTTGQEIGSQLYSVTSDAWSPHTVITAGSPNFPHPETVFPLALANLHDGTPLLVTGSCSFGCGSNSAFLYDVQSGGWSRTTALVSQGGPMVVLPDGRALVVGVGSFAPWGAQLFRPDNSSPRLAVFPGAVDFGSTSPPTTSEQTLTVQNTGSARLTGTVTTTSPFRVVSASPFTLAPGANASVVVQFSSTGFGAFSGVVEFTSNGNWLSIPATAGVGVRLSGRVTDTNGAEVSGVTVNLTGATGGNTMTDENGRYQFLVAPNNGYNVTPASGGLKFSPGTRSVLVTTQDISGLDFAATFPDAVAAFIAGLYRNVLGRAPDAPGLAGWFSFLHRTCNPSGFSGIADGFFDSPEFRLRPVTITDLVNLLYRALLLRDPEPAGLLYWSDVLRQHRLALVPSFVESPEFLRLLPDRTDRQAVTTLIVRLYTEILGRTAGVQEIAGWVNYITTSGDVAGMTAVLFTTQDFERRALTIRDYVSIVYRAILERAPEPAGLDYWEGVLRSSLLSVINGNFIPSQEFQGLIPVICGG